jgi:hypothetical protein
MILIDHDYHVVELHWIPDEVIDWCSKQYGEHGDRWFTGRNKIYFKNKLDHMMFLVRWS